MNQLLQGIIIPNCDNSIYSSFPVYEVQKHKAITIFFKFLTIPHLSKNRYINKSNKIK
jgi:hypothetical protein